MTITESRAQTRWWERAWAAVGAAIALVAVAVLVQQVAHWFASLLGAF